MRSGRLIGTWLLAVAAWSFAAGAAEGSAEAPALRGTAGQASSGTRLPQARWALGTLAIRNLGGAFDLLAASCDAVAANSGPLARLSLMSWLFPVPLDDGFDPDGAALVFFLDPGVAGASGEKAFLLPVADVAVVKAALEASFGVKERDGVFKATLPQGLNEPDKALLIRVAGKKLLAAPNAELLKELADLAGEHGAAAFVDPKGPDAVVDVDLAALRRQKQNELETALGWAVKLAGQAYPDTAPSLAQWQARLLERAKELGRLEVRVSLQDRSVAILARLETLPNTDLAQRWEKEPARPALAWLPWCTPETAAFVTGSLPPALAAVKEETLAALLQRFCPLDGDGTQAVQARGGKGLSEFLALLGGEAACSLVVQPDGSWHPCVMLGARDTASASKALDEVLAAGTEVLGHRLRAEFKLPAHAPPPVSIRKAAPAEDAPARHELGFNAPEVEQEAKDALARLCGWPLEFSSRAVAPGLIVGGGRGAEALLAANPKPVAANPLGPLPPGTAGCALVRPATGLKVYLRSVRGLPEATVEELLKGLSDAPLQASWGLGGGGVHVRLVAPVEALRTGVECYLRLLRQGFDPLGGRGPAKPPAPRNVPGPPPPAP
jgi:hypothetical protein